MILRSFGVRFLRSLGRFFDRVLGCMFKSYGVNCSGEGVSFRWVVFFGRGCGFLGV